MIYNNKSILNIHLMMSNNKSIYDNSTNWTFVCRFNQNGFTLLTNTLMTTFFKNNN